MVEEEVVLVVVEQHMGLAVHRDLAERMGLAEHKDFEEDMMGMSFEDRSFEGKNSGKD